MKPTDLNILQCAEAASQAMRDEGTALTLRLIRKAIEYWETIRPNDDTQLARTNHALALELSQAKATIAELISSKHPPAPKPTPEEIERREFDEWVKSEGYANYPDVHKSHLWEAWKAARATPTTPTP